MQRPGQKRQIIKTRSQRPYIIARIVIVLVVIALVVWITLVFVHGQHHAAVAGPPFCPPESRIGFVR